MYHDDIGGVPVVLAEDDFIQRAYAAKVLTNLGYTVIEAENGNEALDRLRETGAQILVCDLDMPGMNGNDLVRAVRDTQGHSTDRYVHILMITGSAQKGDREAALKAGVDDFMGKPLDVATLKARVRSAERLIEHEKLLAERTRVLIEANERIAQDLDAAAKAQRRLIPANGKPVQGYEFYSDFEPSFMLSGDMYGYFPVSDQHIGIYAVDVSGHGIRASLMSVALGYLLTPAYFRKNAFDDAGRPDPARLVQKLDRRFFDEDDDEYFTMFCGIIETATGRVDYCQAGYPLPWRVMPDGSAQIIGTGGYPVALLEGAEFENARIDLPEGAFLALCSDGATEAEAPSKQQFGERGVEEIVREHANIPSSIPAALKSALRAWTGSHELEDDLSVIVCERKTAR